MEVLGVSVRTPGREYRVAWALVDGSRVVDSGILTAPSEHVSRGLTELEERFANVLASRPDLVALRQQDLQKAKPSIAKAARAEGVLLATAAKLGINAVEVSPNSFRRFATTATKHRDAAKEACDNHLSTTPADVDEIQAAAAAVVASGG